MLQLDGVAEGDDIDTEVIIPRETEGYGVERVRLSVRPSVRLSVCLSVPLDIGYIVQASCV